MKKRCIVDTLVAVVIIGVFLGGCYVNYHSYYYQTKPAIRYNDFEMLAFTLPQVLPRYIADKDEDHLEAVVALAGKNFGIVVDAPSLGRKWSTQNKYQNFIRDVEEGTKGKVYLIPILNVAYACSDWQEQCVHSLPEAPTERLGTLFLIHQDKPSFQASMTKWFMKLVELEISVLPNFTMLTICFLLTSVYVLIRRSYFNWQKQKGLMHKTLLLLEGRLSRSPALRRGQNDE